MLQAGNLNVPPLIDPTKIAIEPAKDVDIYVSVPFHKPTNRLSHAEGAYWPNNRIAVPMPRKRILGEPVHAETVIISTSDLEMKRNVMPDGSLHHTNFLSHEYNQQHFFDNMSHRINQSQNEARASKRIKISEAAVDNINSIANDPEHLSAQPTEEHVEDVESAMHDLDASGIDPGQAPPGSILQNFYSSWFTKAERKDTVEPVQERAESSVEAPTVKQEIEDATTVATIRRPEAVDQNPVVDAPDEKYPDEIDQIHVDDNITRVDTVDPEIDDMIARNVPDFKEHSSESHDVDPRKNIARTQKELIEQFQEATGLSAREIREFFRSEGVSFRSRLQKEKFSQPQKQNELFEKLKLRYNIGGGPMQPNESANARVDNELTSPDQIGDNA